MIFRSNSADSSLTGEGFVSSPFHHTNHQQQQDQFTSSTMRQDHLLNHRRVELGAAQELNIGGELR
jgi:hypothetical protein